jgi:hypothetical protein
MLSTNYSFAQIQGEDEVYLNNDLINPEFPGGLDMFYGILMKRLDQSKIKTGEKLLVSFTIDELGEMKKVKILQFKDQETAMEVLTNLKNFPKWIPANKLEKPVSVELKIPIIFN